MANNFSPWQGADDAWAQGKDSSRFGWKQPNVHPWTGAGTSGNQQVRHGGATAHGLGYAGLGRAGNTHNALLNLLVNGDATHPIRVEENDLRTRLCNNHQCEYSFDDRPVCANGVTYRNKCEARCHGVAGYSGLRAGVCGAEEGSSVGRTSFFMSSTRGASHDNGFPYSADPPVRATGDHRPYSNRFNPTQAHGRYGQFLGGGQFASRAPYDLHFGPF